MTTTIVPFSAAIRDATSAAHGDAEGSTFLADLTGGHRPLVDLARLAAQHLAIYRALEGANAAMATDPVAGRFVFAELDRVPALERDLASLLGPDWASRPESLPTAATAAYAARITETAETWPAGWVAHHYTRYLGDLSGGLFIRRALEDRFAIDATSGTAFYDFPGIADPVAWKDDYRSRLDEAPWDDDERARIIDEVLDAYRWNTRVLVDLDG